MPFNTHKNDQETKCLSRSVSNPIACVSNGKKWMQNSLGILLIQIELPSPSLSQSKTSSKYLFEVNLFLISYQIPLVPTMEIAHLLSQKWVFSQLDKVAVNNSAVLMVLMITFCCLSSWQMNVFSWKWMIPLRLTFLLLSSKYNWKSR